MEEKKCKVRIIFEDGEDMDDYIMSESAYKALNWFFDTYEVGYNMNLKIELLDNLEAIPLDF